MAQQIEPKPESRNEPAHGNGLLATPLDLWEDSGLIGDLLRDIPHDILEEAEKQDNAWLWLAKWVVDNPVQRLFFGTQESVNDECGRLEREGFRNIEIGVYLADEKARLTLQIREVRFYFHRNDANKRVMRIVMDTRWPDCFRRAFEAAASQHEALIRLVEVGRRGGSLSKSWRTAIITARQAGDVEAEQHAVGKVAASLLSHEPYRTWLLKDPTTPDLVRDESHRRYDLLYKADLRKIGRTKADEKWKGTKPLRFKMASHSDKIAEALSTGWLRVGEQGFPGLCFMSDELLGELLGHTLPLGNLLRDRLDGGKFIWGVRNDLGLKQAELLFIGLEEIAPNKWLLIDRQGKRTSHWICREGRLAKLPPKL